MKDYVVVVCILLTLLSCIGIKNPVNSPQPSGYQIAGRVYDLYRDGFYNKDYKGYIENAIIEIGDMSDTTSQYGGFLVKGLAPTQYHLKITHPDCQLYLDTIDVSSDTTINFKVTPILGDYFPLEIGAEWQYNYNESFSVGAPQYILTSINTWKVVNKEIVTNATKYTIEEILREQVKIRIDGVPRSDTLYLQDETTYFSVLEDSDGFLTFDDKKKYPYKFARYCPIRIGDSLSISNGWRDYVLKRDVGMSKYWNFAGVASCRTIYEYVLRN